MIEYCNNSVKKNRVNLNYCTDPNIGDILSPIICEFLLKKEKKSLNDKVERTKHLYAIGSILTMGQQDAVVWGSGALNEESLYHLLADYNYRNRKLDIRAVRGKYTKELLKRAGYQVGDVLGDPAIIMPEIYDPRNRSCGVIEKKYKVSVIAHSDVVPETWKTNKDIHIISIKTFDYKNFIDEILASEKVISSSLHGIILAETYGVPAIMILNDVWNQIFKFYDWYSATNRSEFAIASSLESALFMETTPLPELEYLRQGLIDSFPYDIF